MSIEFYSMDGCGWCKKALAALAEQINNGTVSLKTAQEAVKYGANGFPFFRNPANGQTTSGWPGSLSAIYEKLGVTSRRENYARSSIEFFSMEGCGWCVKAKAALEEQIQNGTITLQSAQEAMQKYGANGFPFFRNPANGQTTSGWPGSLSALYEKLGISASANTALADAGASPCPFPNWLKWLLIGIAVIVATLLVLVINLAR